MQTQMKKKKTIHVVIEADVDPAKDQAFRKFMKAACEFRPRHILIDSTPQDVLREFNENVLRLVQMTRKRKPKRFAETSVPASDLSQLGGFLAEVAAAVRVEVDASAEAMKARRRRTEDACWGLTGGVVNSLDAVSPTAQVAELAMKSGASMSKYGELKRAAEQRSIERKRTQHKKQRKG
jgi:hypothetical protein